jgi:hypothetical protein
MIQVSRSSIRQFRAVLRRSVLQNWRKSAFQPAVEFDAGPGGLTIRSQLDGIAVAYQTSEPQERELLRLPASALEDFEGRGSAQVRSLD